MEKGYKIGMWLMMVTILSLQATVYLQSRRINNLQDQIKQIHISRANSAMRTNDFRDKINGYHIPEAVQVLEAEINELQNRVSELEKK